MSRGLVADSRSLVYASCSSIYDQDNHRCPGVFRTELQSSSHTTLLVSHHLQMGSGLSPCVASLLLSCLCVCECACVCVRRSLFLCVCRSLSILLHSRLPPPCPKLSIIPRELFTPVYEVQCLKKEADTVEANEAMSLNRSACRLSGVDLSFTKSRLLISTNLNRRALDIQRHSWL